MPIDITNVDEVYDDPTLKLDGAIPTTSVIIGGVTYVFVGGYYDAGISVFILETNGTLTPVFDIGSDGTLNFDGIYDLEVATIGGNTYLFAASMTSNGISVLQVNNDGSLTPVQSVDDSAGTLMGTPWALTPVTIGARSFLYVGSTTEAGLTIFEIASDGTLTHVANVADADNAAYRLTNVRDVTTALVGGNTFLIAAGADEGFDVFQIAADGTLTQTGGFNNAGWSEIAGTSAVLAVTIGSSTFLVVAGMAGNGLLTFELASDGTVSVIDLEVDDGDTYFGWASALTSFTVGAETYVVAAGSDWGATIFRMDATGNLELFESVSGTALGGQNGLGVAVSGGVAHLLVTGWAADAIGVYRLTAENALPVRAGDNVIEVNEGQSVTITSADLDYDDADQIDSGIVYTVESLSRGYLSRDGVLLNTGSTFTQQDIEDGLIVYSHDGAETLNSDELRFTISDGQGYVRTNRVLTIWTTAVNDYPVVDLNGNAAGIDTTAAWSTGASPVKLAPSARLTDPDSEMGGGSLTVDITGNGQPGDVLGIAAENNISLQGNDVYYGVYRIGTFTGGTNGDPLVVEFVSGGDMSLQAARALMRSITFSSSSGSTDQRTITFFLNDGGGTANGGSDLGSAEVTVNVTATTGPADADITANLREDDYSTNTVTLILYDSDSTNPGTFTLTTKPANGNLVRSDYTYLDTGVAYQADHYDHTLGAWVLTVNFWGDTNWFGQDSFSYFATTAGGTNTDGAFATLNVAAVADAPYAFSGVEEPPRLINNVIQTTSTSGTTEDSPVTISLANGDTLVIWQAGTSTANIRAQYYDSAGVPRGSAFNVTATGGNAELQPSAAANANGTFAITYIVNTGGGGDVVTAFFADGGTTAIATINTAANSGIREADPTVTAVGDGYVVTWAVQASANATIRAQRYNSDGTTSGSAFDVVTGATRGSGTGTSFNPPDHRVSAVGNGDFVVVSQHGTNVQAKLVLANGTQVALGIVNSASGADQPSVSRLADGGFVIVWRQTDSGNENVHARVYEADGTPRSVDLTLWDSFGQETSPEVIGLADGRFVVVWLGHGNDDTRDVWAASYKADGSPHSHGVYNVSYTGGTTNESQPSVAVDANGVVTVSWLNNRGAGNREDVMFARLDPGITIVTGEAGTGLTLPTTFGLSSHTEYLHSIVIDGLPAGMSFAMGARDPNDATRWIIDRNSPDGTAFLDNFNLMELQSPASFDGSFTLGITFVSAELSDSSNTAGRRVEVPVHLTAAPPAPNQAPVLDLDQNEIGSGSMTGWTAGDGPVALSQQAIFTDDNTSYSGATVTAAITANGRSGDTLTILSVGDGMNEIRVDGSSIYYEGVLVGTFTGGANGNPLVVTFNASACHCSVQNVIASIAFDHPGANPGAANRTVTITLVDGGGTANGGMDTAVAEAIVDMTPINATPVVQDDTAYGAEDDASVTITLIAYDDDPTNPASFTITSLPGHGQLVDVNGVPVLVNDGHVASFYNSSLGAWVLPLYYRGDADWSGQDSITYFSTDNEYAVSGSAELTIDISPVADGLYMLSGIGYPPQLTDTIRNVTSTSSTTEDGPVVIGLANGYSLVVWQSGLTGSNIRARYYDEDGVASGSFFNVTATGGTAELLPAAAANANGSFAIAYAAGGNITAAFYADGGTTPTATATVAAETAFEIDPMIAASGDGFVVTWAVESGATATILARRYGSDGTPSGAAFTVVTGADKTGTGTSMDPAPYRLTDLGNGVFLVVTEHGSDLHATLVRANGNVVSLGTVNAAAGADQPAVARTADGGFVLVWHQTESGGEESIHARVYDSNGVGGTEVTLTGAGYIETAPEVAMLADGRFVLVYVGNDGVDGTRDIFAQTFNADGTPASFAPRNISASGGLANESQPSVAVDADGLISVSWINNRGSGNREDVMVAQLAIPPSWVNAEAGQMVLLPVGAVLRDTDGSERLETLVIENLPAGFSFDFGARDPNDATRWVIDRSDPDWADFLDEFGVSALLMVHVAQGYSGRITLDITGTTIEIADPTQTLSASVSVPMVITSTPNEAPVLDLDPVAPGNNAALDWKEGDGPTELAYFATFTDDNTSYAGAKVTAEFTANGSADDILSIVSVGDGLGQIRVTGSTIYYEGVAVGTFTGGTNGNPLVVDFNSAACHCAVELAIASIAFDNPGNTPSTAQRTVRITLVDGGGTDGGGADTASAEVTIQVAAVNDAPSGSDSTVRFDEGGSHVVTIADLGYSDPEDDDLVNVVIDEAPSGLTLDGIAVNNGQTIAATDISAGKLVYTPDVNGFGNGYARIRFSVQDDGGTANGGANTAASPSTLTFDVTNVPDGHTGGIALGGAPVQGEVLTVRSTLADLDGMGTLHYQWQRDTGSGFVTVGGDQATYTLGAADVGGTIRVVVSYTDGGGTLESETALLGAPVIADARTTTVVYDTMNNKPWTSITTKYDALGGMESQTFALDNGGVWVNNYDTANNSPVLWASKRYDASNNFVQRVTAFDNGTFQLTLYDARNEYGWFSMTVSYDANWVQTGVTGIRDNFTPGVTQGEVDAVLDNIMWFTTPYDPNFNSTATDDTITGGSGADILYGFGGNDTIFGMGGNDFIVGGRGNDTLTGGAGSDTFSFRLGDGDDIITDFESGIDLIDLHGYGITSFADLLARMAQDGNDVVITLDAENSVTLQDVQIVELSSGDFTWS